MQNSGGGRFATIVTVIVVVAAGVAAYAALQPQAAAGAAAGRARATVISNRATVDVGSVILTVPATGSIIANQQSNLAFADQSAIVKQILVQQGQSVKKGDQLALVDDSSQQAAVQQAQLTVQNAQSALNKLLQPVDPNTILIAQNSVKSAEASYQGKASSGPSATDIKTYQDKVAQAQTAANYSFQLMNQVGGRYATTDPNYQLAQAQYGQAGLNLQAAQISLAQEQSAGSSLLSVQANIALAQAKLIQAEAGPAQSDIDTAQSSLITAQNSLVQAQHALAKTILVAPYDGTITGINIKVGAPAAGAATTTATTGATPAMIIADVSKLYALINVDESDITTVASGQKVSFTIDALQGVTLTGKVDRIYPIADATASVITYAVRVNLDATTQPIRAGMTVNATFYVKQLDNVVRVPNNYLRVNAATGQTTVNVINPDGTTVSPAPVKVGIAGTDYTEIIEGLTAGENIALTATTGTTGTTGAAAGGAGGGGGFGGPPPGGG